ncbi:MAG: glycosyltransferase, partial [Methanobacteriota archaeon]
MALSDAEWASEFEPIQRSNPPRPGRALHEAKIPMTGPGADSTVRATPDGDGIFGGSHAPAGEAEPSRPIGHVDCARSIIVLLPALNEEMAVGSVISRIPTERLRRSGYDVRVWVVDGKSTDATLQVARDRGASTYVQSGEGKGNGVRQALNHLLNDRSSGAAAGSRLFVMLDADGSYPPEDIPSFVDALESGSDVVVGSRFRGHVEDGAMTSLNRLGN